MQCLFTEVTDVLFHATLFGFLFLRIFRQAHSFALTTLQNKFDLGASKLKWFHRVRYSTKSGARDSLPYLTFIISGEGGIPCFTEESTFEQ